jgi:hypothetical protein
LLADRTGRLLRFRRRARPRHRGQLLALGIASLAKLGNLPSIGSELVEDFVASSFVLGFAQQYPQLLLALCERDETSDVVARTARSDLVISHCLPFSYRLVV